jgi:hypothetical protein
LGSAWGFIGTYFTAPRLMRARMKAKGINRDRQRMGRIRKAKKI